MKGLNKLIYIYIYIYSMYRTQTRVFALYFHSQVLGEKFGVRCFLGLTATATRATAASVAEHLGIVHDSGAVIRGGAVPSNLFLSVSCDSDRTQVNKSAHPLYTFVAVVLCSTTLLP